MCQSKHNKPFGSPAKKLHILHTRVVQTYFGVEFLEGHSNIVKVLTQAN